MITKRLKVYILCPYVRIKYKGILFTYKKGEVLTSKYQKEVFTLNMFPKNKQNKLRQMKKDDINKGSNLNYKTAIKYAFCFLVCLFFTRKTC